MSMKGLGFIFYFYKFIKLNGIFLFRFIGIFVKYGGIRWNFVKYEELNIRKVRDIFSLYRDVSEFKWEDVIWFCRFVKVKNKFWFFYVYVGKIINEVVCII